MKKGVSKKISHGRAMRIVLVAVQAVTSLILMISLFSTNIVGWREMFLLGGCFLALLALSFIKLIFTKQPTKKSQIVCGLISALCIVASVVALQYTGAFNNLLDKITQPKETKEYGVLVLEKSELKDVKDLNQKNVGFLKADPYADTARKHLQDIVSIKPNSYDDVFILFNNLQEQKSDAIVLESDWVQALSDEGQDFSQSIRIIYTFKIEIDSKNTEGAIKDLTKEPFIVYISGTDSRNGVKATARSDVNIVAVVNPQKGKILLVSIPRDTYVQLRGTTGLKDKLSHAGVYGIDMSKSTIEDFLGIKIDDTVKVSFETVIKTVDELDGIEINSDKEMNLQAEGKNKRCHYTVGKQVVDGDCALRFARERKSYKTGDKHRGENQQQVLTAIINKLSSSKSYLLKFPNIMNIAADSFETSLGKDEITAFIRFQLAEGINWQVESIAIDGEGAMQPTYSMGANLPLYVMYAFPESIDAAKSKIDEYLVVE